MKKNLIEMCRKNFEDLKKSPIIFVSDLTELRIIVLGMKVDIDKEEQLSLLAKDITELLIAICKAPKISGLPKKFKFEAPAAFKANISWDTFKEILQYLPSNELSKSSAISKSTNKAVLETTMIDKDYYQVRISSNNKKHICGLNLKFLKQKLKKDCVSLQDVYDFYQDIGSIKNSILKNALKKPDFYDIDYKSRCLLVIVNFIILLILAYQREIYDTEHKDEGLRTNPYSVGMILDILLVWSSSLYFASTIHSHFFVKPQLKLSLAENFALQEITIKDNENMLSNKLKI